MYKKNNKNNIPPGYSKIAIFFLLISVHETKIIYKQNPRPNYKRINKMSFQISNVRKWIVKWAFYDL